MSRYVCYTAVMRYDNVWYRDGTLRDLCVRGVTVAHWQQMVEWLVTSPYAAVF